MSTHMVTFGLRVLLMSAHKDYSDKVRGRCCKPHLLVYVIQQTRISINRVRVETVRWVAIIWSVQEMVRVPAMERVLAMLAILERIVRRHVLSARRT